MISLLAARGGDRVSRRQMLRLTSSDMVGLALPGWLGSGALASPARKSAARNCIYIFLCGGPSQLDLWDPKPDAPEGIRGPFRPIDTTVPGVRFTELIPQVARHAGKLALVRSMHHGSADHNVGIAHTLLGRVPASVGDVFVARHDHPALGGILHKLRGDCGVLPPWVILPRPFTTLSPPHKGQSAGFLGTAFDPVMLNEPKVDSLAAKDLKVDALDRPAGVDEARFGLRGHLKSTQVTTASGQAEAYARWETDYERAFEMLSGPACRLAFDVTREPGRVRDRYGRNEYGQSFLLARRLVESGVRMVNVFWTYFDPKGCQFNLWDNHGVATDVCGVGSARTGWEMITHDYCTPSFDRAFSALLEDLDQRGLLDQTLVVVAGEFGRTPKVNATAGRDHWPFVYTQILAGGGVRGGQVYGASDRNAAYVKDSPVSPEDFAATVLHAFGVDPETVIFDHLQRPFRVSEGCPLATLFG